MLMRISTKSFIQSTFLTLSLSLCIVLLTSNMLSQDIQFWDEATNLSVIAESAESSDWWNLKLFGGFFWEKPPLFYWLGIFLFKISSLIFPSLATSPKAVTILIRSVSLISGILFAVLIALFVHKFRTKPKTNPRFFKTLIVSFLVILAIPNLWQFNPDQVTLATHNFISADSDALQLLFILLGYFFSQKISKQNAVLTGLFSGAAFLLKGPFGLLPIVISVTEQMYMAIEKRHFSKKTLRFLLIQIFTALLLILPWYVFMSLQFGSSFLEENIIYHQLQRASSALEGHQKSPLFYIEFLLNPATSGILLMTAIAFGIRKFQLTKELLIGVFILIVLSLVGTKLSWYCLYTYPFFLIYIISSLRDLKISPLTKDSLLKTLLVSFVLIFQYIYIFSSILWTNAPMWLRASLPSDQISRSIYLSDRKPHRVFYFQNLVDEKSIFSTDAIHNLEIQNESEIIFDRHEFTEEEIENLFELNLDENYQTKIIHLSHNYAKLLIYET